MTFADRKQAGLKLAEKLVRFKDRRPIVLALPRGGVAVGFEIARALAAPLDVALAQKLGAPDQPELAIGAIALGATPEIVADAGLITALGVSADQLRAVEAQVLAELRRRQDVYRAGRPPAAIRGCTAILVDDGIATGATARAALRATRDQQPAWLVLAVPVAARDSLTTLAAIADEIICLLRPRWFTAVGRFYRHFPQLEDHEVLAFLEQAETFKDREKN